MKRLLPFLSGLLISLLASGCGPGSLRASNAPFYPVLAIDDAHSQLPHADGTQGAKYELAPATGVILDSTGYRFDIPAQLKVDRPNSIQVLIGPQRQYTAEWKPQNGRQVLDASTLHPMKQSPPFAGFQSGDSVVLGIGQTTIEGSTLKFGVIWVGMADVK